MTMGTATATRKMGEGVQTNVKIVTPTPDEIKSVLLADGQWHDLEKVEKVQFAITEAQSPTNPDTLYAGLQCEENGRSVLIPFRQIVGYSNVSGNQPGQSSRSGNQQFGSQSQS